MAVAVTESVLPDGTRLFTWDRGYVQVKKLAPGVIFFRKAGYLVNPLYDAVIDIFTDEVESAGKLIMICDCYEFENYEAGYRQLWQDWFSKHKGSIRAPILFRSAFVKMGVQLVNMIVKVFEPYSDEPAFLSGVANTWPQFQRDRLPPRYKKAS